MRSRTREAPPPPSARARRQPSVSMRADTGARRIRNYFGERVRTAIRALRVLWRGACSLRDRPRSHRQVGSRTQSHGLLRWLGFRRLAHHAATRRRRKPADVAGLRGSTVSVWSGDVTSSFDLLRASLTSSRVVLVQVRPRRKALTLHTSCPLLTSRCVRLPQLPDTAISRCGRSRGVGDCARARLHLASHAKA